MTIHVVRQNSNIVYYFLKSVTTQVRLVKEPHWMWHVVLLNRRTPQHTR